MGFLLDLQDYWNSQVICNVIFPWLCSWCWFVMKYCTSLFYSLMNYMGLGMMMLVPFWSKLKHLLIYDPSKDKSHLSQIPSCFFQSSVNQEIVWLILNCSPNPLAVLWGAMCEDTQDHLCKKGPAQICWSLINKRMMFKYIYCFYRYIFFALFVSSLFNLYIYFDKIRLFFLSIIVFRNAVDQHADVSTFYSLTCFNCTPCTIS